MLTFTFTFQNPTYVLNTPLKYYVITFRDGGGGQAKVLPLITSYTGGRGSEVLHWQRCKNEPTCQQCWRKKNPILGKIFTKFYAVLLKKWVMSRFHTFWWHFLAHLKTLCYFFALFGSLGRFTLFCGKFVLLFLRIFFG